jgi:alkylation response protein AidB-like acyl-CoA dehydrogenase
LNIFSNHLENNNNKDSKKELISISRSIFGDQIPFGDPVWYQDWFSPYYNDSHRRFRAAMREWVEREIIPYCHEWDENKHVPHEIRRKAFEAGWLPAVAGGKWPTEVCCF